MTVVDSLNPWANPEFRRYLWTEFSTHRLIAMPLLLGLLFLGAHSAFGQTGLDQAVQATLFVVLVIWGGRQAAGAVTDEVVSGTWDAQRMSGVSPWSMTWGKLLGATAYPWYGAIICLLALAIAGATTVDTVLSMLLTALIAQGSALFVGLLLQRGQRPSALLGTVTLAQVCAIGVAVILEGQNQVWLAETVHWWSWTVDGQRFLLVSKAMALVWVLVGAHALMRDELRYRPQPWSWLAFLIFVAVYMAGFAEPGALFGGADVRATEAVARLSIAWAVITVLTVSAAVMSLNDSVSLRRWLAAATSVRGQPGALALEAPAWVIGLALCVVLAMGLTMALSAAAAPSWASTMVWCAVLFLIRDIGVILAVTLDGDRRRGTLGAILYLAALYVLLPQVLQDLIPDIAMALRPTEGATIAGALIPALVQAVGAGALVAWRWHAAGRGLSVRTAS